jgi:hypothetical protein
MDEQSTSEQMQEVKVLATGTANAAVSPDGVENHGQLKAAGELGVSPLAPDATPDCPAHTSGIPDESAAAEPTQPRTAPRVLVRGPRLKVAKAALVTPLAAEDAVATPADGMAELAAGTALDMEPEVAVRAADVSSEAMPAASCEAEIAEPVRAEAVDAGALVPRAAHPGKGGEPVGVVPQAHPGQKNPQAAPAKPSLPDPRRRLRELLAIPDRDRSDALWDELIELEIQLAPGNRANSPHPADPGRQPKQQRFAEPGRRPATSPSGASRHHRPQGNVQGLQGAAGGAANPGSGNPGMPKSGKRFFKKSRRGPRPVEKA